ncbi:hypothetical protein FB451DRAFT_651282 [Mycena latifolia]|nr:hypothetical protein FB451DRAFT_651282 [Mycena latifolia]
MLFFVDTLHPAGVRAPLESRPPGDCKRMPRVSEPYTFNAATDGSCPRTHTEPQLERPHRRTAPTSSSESVKVCVPSFDHCRGCTAPTRATPILWFSCHSSRRGSGIRAHDQQLTRRRRPCHRDSDGRCEMLAARALRWGRWRSEERGRYGSSPLPRGFGSCLLWPRKAECSMRPPGPPVRAAETHRHVAAAPGPASYAVAAGIPRRHMQPRQAFPVDVCIAASDGKSHANETWPCCIAGGWVRRTTGTASLRLIDWRVTRSGAGAAGGGACR